MNKQLKVGFITTFSGRWPQELPNKRHETYGAWLKENLPGIDVITLEYLVSTPEAIESGIEAFKKESVDLVVQVYGAFTGDDISVAFAESLQVPIILWAPYEEQWVKEDRLYANALVAMTMNAGSLHRLDYKCYAIYGSKEDQRAADKLINIVKSYDVVKKLKGTCLGLYGYRPTAFYNSAFDEGLIRKTFGVRMEETDLKVIFDRMEQISQAAVDADQAYIQETFKIGELPEGHLENHSRLYLALKEIQKEQGYDYAAIKCWPEMGNLKTTPCAVLGRLADDDVYVECEGDVDATLATIIQNYLTGLPTFITDMININEEENYFTFWHCGNAAKSLHNPKYESTLANHPLAGQGTALWGALKEGKVTIARICNIKGVYKLFLLRGEALDSDRNTRGVMVNVKLQRPVRDIAEQIIAEGIPHHYSIVWADVAEQMIAVADLLGLEVIEM